METKKKKKRRRRREQKFRATVEEAQVLAVFETFFFSPALKLLVWVFETFQEVVSNRGEFEMKENKVGFGSTLRVCVLLFARFNF